ncbi:MAG: hypothetical protein E7376_02770 [Clostridiales bacterium]|nr:hypothetical protein [Clostridiales bacterium]
MAQIEVAFKIEQSKEEAEKLLLDNGFVNAFKTYTRDIYFGKNVNFDGLTEEEIKRQLIRCRNFERLENLKVLDEKLPDKHLINLKLLQRLFKEGYEVIFETQKSDWVYKKGGYWHQLQDIKDIGLLDYVYTDEFLDETITQDEMFEIVKQHIHDLGFKLEYELGVDKLRSLYYKELKFSKNQIGLYKYQEK